MRSYDVETVQTYVKYLTVLAVFSLLTSFVWIFDVILDVKQTLKKIHHDEDTKDPTTDTTPTDGTTPQASDSKIVASYSIQVISHSSWSESLLIGHLGRCLYCLGHIDSHDMLSGLE